VSGSHPDIGPELRQLAQTVLDRIDPALRAAAAAAARDGAGPGRCQQVWCPVCALAALVTGEQHPLLTVIADHSVALLTAIRAMVNDLDAAPAPDRPPPPGGGAPDEERPPPGAGRYQHIPVTVEE
jgi:hypothetical protein